MSKKKVKINIEKLVKAQEAINYLVSLDILNSGGVELCVQKLRAMSSQLIYVNQE